MYLLTNFIQRVQKFYYALIGLIRLYPQKAIIFFIIYILVSHMNK
ncbi:Hypothetical protein DPCES_3456 [Desulfitobacterium hafniense]|uniref:Uncharacterized protein n=1 Tax=Desulfitobacterium hafniense TaxID=49338 RepID=A0A098B4P9_DESHA|nr:Hypothetical protein DPCES_3456 [Desulfitobacterium hafniense]